ncbi:MAG: methyltransferase domain-containing protein [Acidimicrobiia bacterium]|nr:methyltransferase domain-containing protein [Acidimicrobiia bacterium]MXX00357.1 methyltransferase domain-containing protein [Acidimicrobiia bacterium]MXX45011.1 methyltransferase domain-containing protein [Acidimicrobiia bacterium]MXY73538.1 methyltransferase domain-containing protein [Acidimicrobiia bacterium]MYA39126.1 methyltransferase domain-containing protein [Acidimicrobiia bacterium]
MSVNPVADVADAWSGSEYRENTAHHRAFDPPALWSLGLGAGDSLLDVGCGAGDLTAALADHYPRSEVIGIDASPSQIEQACRHERPRLRFEVRRVQDLCWEKRFAAVFSIACLHWIPIPEHPRVLEKIFRALVPGGRLLASFAAETNIEEIRRIIFSIADRPPYRRHLQGRLPHHPWPSLHRYREMLAGSPFGAAEELRTETQPRTFSRTGLTGWLRTQTLTGYRPRLPPPVFEDLVAEVSEKVAELTRAGHGHVVPFVRLQLQARRPRTAP